LEGIVTHYINQRSGHRNCTKPWQENDAACIVGDNGLKYHNQVCYQAYLDSIEKVRLTQILLHLSPHFHPKIGKNWINGWTTTEKDYY
jgi:hypothetical protein